jgi:hypothetical protein
MNNFFVHGRSKMIRRKRLRPHGVLNFDNPRDTSMELCVFIFIYANAIKAIMGPCQKKTHPQSNYFVESAMSLNEQKKRAK